MPTVLKKYSVKEIGVKILRDEDQARTLETYFNDIYHLFLNKLVKVTHESELSLEEVLKLQSLFDELIRVKLLLQDENAERSQKILRQKTG